MKNFLAFVVALAATLGTATAQSGSGSSTANVPHPVPADAHKPSSKPKGGSNVITRSGGQGHNSGAAPKGKVVVAPTTPASSKK